MSHKENDKYLEEVGRAEEDVRDAQESLDFADVEVIKAEQWRTQCKGRVIEYQEILQKLKDKE